jgi:hypothetical protein
LWQIAGWNGDMVNNRSTRSLLLPEHGRKGASMDRDGVVRPLAVETPPSSPP